MLLGRFLSKSKHSVSFGPISGDCRPNECGEIIHVQILVRYITAPIGNPRPRLANRDPLTPWPPGPSVDTYQEIFEGRTGSSIHRSSNAFLDLGISRMCMLERLYYAES